MLGEVTPKVAKAAASSPAFKFLLPLSQEDVKIVGVSKEPLPHLVQEAVEKIKEGMNDVLGQCISGQGRSRATAHGIRGYC